MKNSKKSWLQFVLMLLKMLQSGMELLVLAVNLVMPNMTMSQRYLNFFYLIDSQSQSTLTLQRKFIKWKTAKV